VHVQSAEQPAFARARIRHASGRKPNDPPARMNDPKLRRGKPNDPPSRMNESEALRRGKPNYRTTVLLSFRTFT
jgi:hypothetical protein